MAKIKVTIDTRRKCEKGFPVKIQIANIGKTAYIGTGIYVEENNFTGDNISCVSRNTPNSKKINEHVARIYMDAQSALFELDSEGRLNSMKPSEIVDYISKKNGNATNLDFLQLLNNYKKSLKTDGARRTFTYTSDVIARFFRNSVTLNEINVSFLREFDSRMEDAGIGINTRGIVMRNIRAVINRAIDDGLMSAGDYPFRKFRIRSVVKEQDCLSVGEMRAFYNYVPVSPFEQIAKDVFFLSFFLCGANMKDIYGMEKPSKGKVSFVRSKTSRKSPSTVTISLVPEAKEIISRIKGKKTLVNLCEICNYDTLSDRCKRSFQRIRRKLGIHALSMYYARYTWASMADEIGIDEKVISKSLGHTDNTVAGRHYIKYDWSRTDKANRAVIDHFLNARTDE